MLSLTHTTTHTSLLSKSLGIENEASSYMTPLDKSQRRSFLYSPLSFVSSFFRPPLPAAPFSSPWKRRKVSSRPVDRVPSVETSRGIPISSRSPSSLPSLTRARARAHFLSTRDGCATCWVVLAHPMSSLSFSFSLALLCTLGWKTHLALVKRRSPVSLSTLNSRKKLPLYSPPD